MTALPERVQNFSSSLTSSLTRFRFDELKRTRVMDEELAALVAELSAAQAPRSSSGPVSERVAASIVQQLRRRGLLDDVFFASSGGTLVAKKRLEQDVLEVLAAQGGRARIDDLATALDVDLDAISTVATDLIAVMPGLQLLSAQELLSSDFRASFAAEVQELLHAGGRRAISLGFLATAYSLPLESLRRMLQEALAQSLIVDTHLTDNGMLQTTAFARAQRAKARGALKAATRPVLFSDLSKEVDLSMQELEALGRDLIEDGSLHGQLRSGEYVPSIFFDIQRTAVDNMFQANKWIKKSIFSRLKVSRDCLAYLRISFPNCIELQCSFVTPGLFEELVAAIRACVSDEGFLDPVTGLVVPSDLPNPDLDEILARAVQSTHGAEVFEGRFVVSSKLLQQMKQYVSTFVAKEAQRAIAKRKTINFSLSKTLLESEFPSLKENEAVIECILRYLEPFAQKEFETIVDQASDSAFIGDHALIIKRMTLLDDAFKDHYVYLQCIAKSISKLKDFNALRNQVQIVFRQLYLTEIAGLITEHECLRNMEAFGNENALRDRDGVLVSKEWRSLQNCRIALEKKVREDNSARPKIKALLDEIESWDQSEFEIQAKLKEIAVDCSMVARPLDKRGEKLAFQSRRALLLKKLEKDVTEEASLCLSSLLILLQCKQIMLPMHDDGWPISRSDYQKLLFEPTKTCLSEDRQEVMRIAFEDHDEDKLLELKGIASLKNPSKGLT